MNREIHRLVRSAASAAVRRSVWKFPLLGLLAILASLILAYVARADYSVDRWTGALTNTEPESVSFRVRTYNVISTPGTSVNTAPAFTVSNPPIGFGYSGAGTLRVGIQPKNSSNAAVGSVIDQGTISVTMNGSGYPSHLTWLEVNPLPTGATKYDRLMKRESPYFESGWRTYSSNQAATVVSTPPTNERGTMIREWTEQLDPHSTKQLVIEQDGPFYLTTEKLTLFATPDGGGGIAYEPEEEHTSTDVTVVDPATTHTPSDSIVDEGPEYSSGPIAAPATRPHATADTLDKLDKNQEARATDSQGLLAQIKSGIDSVVNGVAALGGGGPVQAADEAALEAELETNKDSVADTFNKMDAVVDAAASLVSSISLALPSGDPVFYYQFTFKTRTFTLESNDTMDTAMSIVRGLLSALLSFGGVMAAVRILRGAFA